MIYRITDVKIPMDTGDFRLMDRKVVDVMNTMRERHRFLRGMSAWVGFRQVGVPYRRAARSPVKPSIQLRKMLKLAVNAITGFSYFPLQLATLSGFLSAGHQHFGYPSRWSFCDWQGKQLTGQATTLIAVYFWEESN